MLYGEKEENLKPANVIVFSTEPNFYHNGMNLQGLQRSSWLKKVQLTCRLAVRGTAAILSSSMFSWKRPRPELAELEKETWKRPIPFCSSLTQAKNLYVSIRYETALTLILYKEQSKPRSKFTLSQEMEIMDIATMLFLSQQLPGNRTQIRKLLKNQKVYNELNFYPIL